MENNEDYLNNLIAKAKKSWEGVDVNDYMKNLRNDSFDKEVSENLSKEVASYIIEQIKSNMDKATIKCRDLMVGDWITNRNGFPMQITNVGEDYAYATWGDNEGDPWEFDDKDDQPRPIEITDEMFSKNNWKECDYPLPYNHHEYYYVKDEGENHLLWNSEVLSIWLDWEEGKDDGAYANIVIPIKYVHQFQQALRLAEMTESANNFKV